MWYYENLAWCFLQCCTDYTLKSLNVNPCELNIEMNTDTRIIVVALPRTGSRYFCTHLSNLHNLPNLGEIFNLQPDYSVPTQPIVKRLKKIYNTFDKRFLVLKDSDQWVAKIFPHQIAMLESENNDRLPQIYADIFNTCTEHVFLYRRNFRQQVLSFSAAMASGSWNQNRSHISLNLTSNQLINARRFMISEYTQIKLLYNAYPGPIVALEDVTDQYKGYPNYKEISGVDIDQVEDFDVESEIFGIKKEGYCTPLNLNQS
jgi:hypothetical protein